MVSLYVSFDVSESERSYRVTVVGPVVQCV